MKILSLSGFVPEHICDTVRFTGYSGDTAISHYCQYVADYISQVLYDNSIDGAVFPKSCDSTRIIKSYLGETRKFIFQIPVPARIDQYSTDFFANRIKEYKQALESYFGIQITDIEKRIEALNNRNKEIKLLYDNLENISYCDYLQGIHKMLVSPLFEQRVPIVKKTTSNGKRVHLAGSFLTSEEILDVLEKSGLKIVSDNLPESGRLANRKPCEIDGDIYKNISKNMLSTRLSPTQNNFNEIIERDIREIKDKEVEGVIFITQKYCEAYDYLYSVYEKKLNSEGIKSIKISQTNSEGSKKFELALEAFADMI